jgi:Glycosyltransferase WbsX
VTTGNPKALAFYLPQYHPIPENDEWWGKGFTEWHNVTKARPLFPGHYQPHVPGELGYYDLRVPEVRIAQAELARDHGVHGFIYYHYWFHGRRLLERPFEEVLASGSPNFPFALCWANEEWTRGWDAQSGRVLVRQEFSEEDDRAHIRDLLRAFRDPRYITIDGRPLMLIYRPTLVPDLARLSEIWRSEVQRAGFPDLYLCWVESWGPPPGGQGVKHFGLDATVGFMPMMWEQLHPSLETLRGHRVLDYRSAAESAMKLLDSPWKRFPSVMVGWDNTARRARGATIYHDATPENYERWLRVTADSLADVRSEENYLFILAWNEWAEGNHLEPDRHYGRAFLEATRSVLVDHPSNPSADRLVAANRHSASSTLLTDTAERHDRTALDAVGANVGALLAELGLSADRPVIDLVEQEVAAPRKAPIHWPGIEVVPGTFTDVASLKATLDEVGEIGAVLLINALQHLAEPQELLTALSSWSLEHGSLPLLVTVPQIAHLDIALQVLCGQFEVQETGPLDPANLRFFTEETLQRLIERSGWDVVARDDLHSLYSDHYDEGLRNGLPEELVGALQATAEAVNPNWSVTQFVWLLEPRPVELAPSSYGEAVAPPAAQASRSIDPMATAAVADYLASVGLVASEVNRRAVSAHRILPATGPSLSRPKRALLRVVYSSPRRAAAFNRVYGRLR